MKRVDFKFYEMVGKKISIKRRFLSLFVAVCLVLGGIAIPQKAFAVDISSCQTLSTADTTYTLTQNISAGVGSTCLTVANTGITINGAGYTITGNIVSDVAAAYSFTVKNVTVGAITSVSTAAGGNGGAITIIDSTTGDINTSGTSNSTEGSDANGTYPGGAAGTGGEGGWGGIGGAVHITDSTVGDVTTSGGEASGRGGNANGADGDGGDTPCSNGGTGGNAGNGGAGGNITTVNSTTGTKSYNGGASTGAGGTATGGSGCSDGTAGSAGSAGADGTYSNLTSITISSVASVASAAQTTATITWTTDVLSSSRVQYGLTSSYGSLTAIDSTETYSHSVELTGLLSPLTSYHFSVISAGSTYTSTSTDNSLITHYDSQFGSAGSGNGQFSSPYHTDVDSSGNIYVVDSGNNRIQKFDSSGTYITKWGSSGSGNSQFSSAYGIAVDSSGNVYVSDGNNNRIQKFDSSGTYITKWGSSGSGNGQFSNPRGVAIDSSGNVYVADYSNSRIQKFDSSGTYITKWGSSGPGNGQFNLPLAITIDSSDNVYVADTGNSRIQKFDTSGTYVTKWGSYGTSNGAFDSPQGVDTDSSGNVYVADYNNNRIQKFSSSGTYQTKWGSFGSDGSGNGQFAGPRDVTLDSSDNIYVDDTNRRVQKFDSINDTTAPVISEVTPVTTPTNDTTPNYTFTTNEAGTISYGGDCSSGTTSASSGSNTITFSSLAAGAHSNCTIIVTDAAGNASNSLSVTAFTIDTTAPTVTSISSSDTAAGSYTVGQVIDIDVTFSEAVTSTGNVTVTLETGATDRTCTFTVSGATTGTCNYTVQSGDTSSDLDATISGTIADAAGNAMSSYTPTTGLAANEALVIDTTAPVISEVTAVTTPTSDSSPDYIFTTSEAGTISYGGSCSSATTAASSGSNTITLASLADGTYSDCTVIVTDAAGNASNTLTMTSFTVSTAVAETPVSSTRNGGSRGYVPLSLPIMQEMIQTPVVESVSEVIGNLVPDFLKPKPPKVTPVEPIPVSEEPQLSLEGKWNLIPDTTIDKFVLADLPSDIGKLIIKFPELGKTFNSLGVASVADLSRLHDVKFNLPRIADKANPPTEVILAKTGEGGIDVSTSVSVGENGAVSQTIHTLGGKPIVLQIKPEGKAKSVKGYLTFKKKKEAAALDVPMDSLLARAMIAVGSLAEKAQADSIETELLIIDFEYKDPDGDGIYTADIKTPLVEGEYEVITIIDYENVKLGTKEIRMTTVIDPEGYIYELDSRDREIRIDDAKVSLFKVSASGESLWDADKYSQDNPQITDKTGKYAFLVPEGMYYITVESDGYDFYKTSQFEVREGNPVHENIELIRSHAWLYNLLDWKLAAVLIVLAVYATRFIERRKRRVK